VCKDARRTYLWMPLDKDGAVPPADDDLRISSAGGEPAPPTTEPEPEPAPEPEKGRRRVAVTRPDETGNGRHANGHAAEGGAGLDELIQEAEALRASLWEACGRLGQFAVN